MTLFIVWCPHSTDARGQRTHELFSGFFDTVIPGMDPTTVHTDRKAISTRFTFVLFVIE